MDHLCIFRTKMIDSTMQCTCEEEVSIHPGKEKMFKDIQSQTCSSPIKVECDSL